MMAAGSYGAPSSPHGLLEHWNGRAWSRSSIPPGAAFLEAVACTCWAVGAACTAGGTGEVPVVDGWNGTRWSPARVVPGTASARVSFADSVTCPSASSCYALGGAGRSFTGPMRTLLLSWDGRAWSTLHAGLPTTDDLLAMECSGPGRCVGIGADFAGGVLRVRVMAAKLVNGAFTAMPVPRPSRGD